MEAHKICIVSTHIVLSTNTYNDKWKFKFYNYKYVQNDVMLALILVMPKILLVLTKILQY